MRWRAMQRGASDVSDDRSEIFLSIGIGSRLLLRIEKGGLFWRAPSDAPAGWRMEDFDWRTIGRRLASFAIGARRKEL